MRLEDLTRGATVRGILPDRVITVIDTQWHGSDVITLTYNSLSARQNVICIDYVFALPRRLPTALAEPIAKT